MLVFPAGHMLQPFPVLKVPVDGEAEALLEGDARLPSQLAVDLGGIDGVTAVVTGTVLYVGDEGLARAGRVAQLLVHQPAEQLHQVDVPPFVEPADVIGLTRLSLVEYKVDG